MCMLGSGIRRMDVPRERAIRASKRFIAVWTQHSTSQARFSATAFTTTAFIEDGKRKTTRYRIGHDYATVKPTKWRRNPLCGDDFQRQEGNGRGFWAYRKDHANTSIGEKTLTVLLWGRVVEHQFGYRAERMRILRQAIPQ